MLAARNEARGRDGEIRAKEQEMRAKEQEMRVRDQDIRTKDHELAQLSGVRDECRRMQARCAELERDHQRARDTLTAEAHKQVGPSWDDVTSYAAR